MKTSVTSGVFQLPDIKIRPQYVEALDCGNATAKGFKL